ncbi:uncharacterized protein CTRU02_210937 [Colletotrichum truncatum]|uniref:Uncharacterized protein n=1 Tax=Colletotrichum truncatum TaxID=5467 RepID=A0ACC3YQD1_COLTU
MGYMAKEAQTRPAYKASPHEKGHQKPVMPVSSGAYHSRIRARGFTHVCIIRLAFLWPLQKKRQGSGGWPIGCYEYPFLLMAPSPQCGLANNADLRDLGTPQVQVSGAVHSLSFFLSFFPSRRLDTG